MKTIKDLGLKSYFYDITRNINSEFLIAGGSILDYYLFGKVNGDIDVFFKNENDFNLACKKFDSFIVKNKIHEDTKLSSKDATLYIFQNFKIHLIKKFFYVDINNLFGDFDMTVCCAAFDGLKLHCCDSYFEDIVMKKIIFTNLDRPLNTLKRAFKYSNKKGFTVDPKELIKISYAISNVEIDKNIEEFY